MAALNAALRAVPGDLCAEIYGAVGEPCAAPVAVLSRRKNLSPMGRASTPPAFADLSRQPIEHPLDSRIDLRDQPLVVLGCAKKLQFPHSF
jgi:hypothetical protein